MQRDSPPNAGWYWSSTLSRLVVYESRLELARIMLADFDSSVTGIVAQPFLLTGADGTRERRHVPDLLLVSADGGVTVVDVKAPSRMADPGVCKQFAWTRRACAGRGWAFQTWSRADPQATAPRHCPVTRFLARWGGSVLRWQDRVRRSRLRHETARLRRPDQRQGRGGRRTSL